MNGGAAKSARLYRMVIDKHVCPYGLKARHLLETKGFAVEDHSLTTRDKTDGFKARHDVGTIPQVFIGDKRIGGYTDLRAHFGNPVRDPDAVSYRPVLAIFAVGALLAISFSWSLFGNPLTIRAAEWFVSFSMAVLAMLTL